MIDRLPRVIAAVGGVVLVVFGGWAMVSPESFFETIALFEPYNGHFILDIGAFQLGLGATLLLAAFFTDDALLATLVGVGLGALAHVISHVVSLDSGGSPEIDVPSLSVLTIVLLIGGVIRWSRRRV